MGLLHAALDHDSALQTPHSAFHTPNCSMNNVLRLAIVDPNDASRDAVKTMLLGMDMIWLEAECSRYEFFSDVVAQTHPEIALVAIDSNHERGLELVARLNSESPDCNIFVVSNSNDGSVILRAMRAGAKEFLTQPLRIEDLLEALNRLSDRKFGRDQSRTRGSAVIAVAGACGGVGSTSIAVNLACALAKDADKSVALLDLDLCLGDADVFLDTIPDYTLVDVAQNVTRLDFSLLKRSLTKHSSGLYLLPRPVQIDDISLITPDSLQRVLGLMKASFTHLVIDLSKGYTANDMVAMQMATAVLLVTQMDLPCLRNVVRLLMSFGDMDGLADKVRVVVNRVGLSDGQISLKKAQDTIGREIYWQLPNDYRTMVEVRNNGVPLLEQAPRAAITQSILALADVLSGTESAEMRTADAGGKKSLGKLFGFLSKEKGAK
jgi:pilus assembly protein CpaE